MTPEFLYSLPSLLVALADRPSRYALYAARNPEASRAYVAGREVPPWGLVRTMLRDLAVSEGAPDAAASEVARAQALHQAATAAALAVPRPAAPGAAWSPFAPQARSDARPAEREPARGPRGARFAGATVEDPGARPDPARTRGGGTGRRTARGPASRERRTARRPRRPPCPRAPAQPPRGERGSPEPRRQKRPRSPRAIRAGRRRPGRQPRGWSGCGERQWRGLPAAERRRGRAR